MKEIVESHQTGHDASWVVCIPCSHCLGSNRAMDQVVGSRCSLRPAVRADVDIMVDCHLQPASVEVARDFIRAPELTRPLFIEGPVPTGNPSGMMALTGSSSVTIAGGERLAGGWEFSSAIEGRAFHIAEPGTCHVGGLLETKRVAAADEIAGIGLAPHNPLGPVAGVAPLHSGISRHLDELRHPAGNPERRALLRRGHSVADGSQARRVGSAGRAGPPDRGR